MLIPTFGAALAADVIDVETKERYEPGDNVEVKGYTNVTATVTVIITNSTDEIILTDNPNEKGKFSVEFTLGEDASGLYEVNATVGSIYDTTSFNVVAESDDGDEVMTLEDLLSAIKRAFRFINKASATAEALPEDYNVTFFLEKVNALNESLKYLYKNANDVNLEASVEEFSNLRNEISQLSGLLNSITKNVKGEKAQQFTERMIRQIDDLKGKIDDLEDSAELGEFRSNLDAHKRKLDRLWLTLNSTIPQEDLKRILDELDGVTQGVDSGFGLLGDEGLTWKEMFKLQAKIDVFNATIERMIGKGKTMNRLQEKLDNAEKLMGEMRRQFEEKNWGKMKGTIDDANESLRGIGKTIRDMNKSNKGGNGKSNGNKKG